MGHDTHFLSRLQRVEGRALDLALGLYRDTPLLHWTLGRLPLADSDEVVALPLNNAPQPPYALVTRTGKFITCLAAGMRPDEGTRVTWDALTAATREMEAWRALRAEGQDRTNLVIRRMHTAGPWLPREDFEDLLVISAMAPTQFLDDLLDITGEVFDFRDRYEPRLFRKLTDQSRGLLSSAWKLTWATAHAGLVYVESVVRQEQIRPANVPVVPLLTRALLPAGHHLDGMFVRAGWSVGRLGRLVKDEAMRRVEEWVAAERSKTKESGSFIPIVLGLYGLLAMAVRSPELHDEVHTQLSAMLPASLLARIGLMRPVETVNALMLEGLGPVTGCVVFALALLREAPDFESSRFEMIKVMARFLNRHRVGKRPEPVEPEPPLGPPDVEPAVPSLDAFPEDLIYVIPFNSYENTLADDAILPGRLQVMPVVANRDAVGHFFPKWRLEEMSQHFRQSTSIDDVLAYLNEEYRVRVRVKTVTRPATPGRNEACSCGSGKKYKKCCGA
jgi:hypothetical protein